MIEAYFPALEMMFLIDVYKGLWAKSGVDDNDVK